MNFSKDGDHHVMTFAKDPMKSIFECRGADYTKVVFQRQDLDTHEGLKTYWRKLP